MKSQNGDVLPMPPGPPRYFRIILALIAAAVLVGSIVMVAAILYVNKRSVKEVPETAAPPAEHAPGGTEKDRTKTESGGLRARINSPTDGSLDLRKLPDTTSDELAKIPHGETITVSRCQEEFARVGSRSGHWCVTSYDGSTGWVFDAWLDIPSPVNQ